MNVLSERPQIKERRNECEKRRLNPGQQQILPLFVYRQIQDKSD